MTTTSDSSSFSSSATSSSHSHARHDHRGLYKHFHHGHLLPSSKRRKEGKGAAMDSVGKQLAQEDTDRGHLRRRTQTTDSSASRVTEVVQTVSVVQYIDGLGSAVSLYTINPVSITDTQDTALPFTITSPDAIVAKSAMNSGASSAISSTEPPSTAAVSATETSSTLRNESTVQQTSSTTRSALRPATNSTASATSSGAVSPLITSIAGTGVLPGAYNSSATLHIFGNSTLDSASLHNTLFVKSTRTSSTHSHLTASSSSFSSSYASSSTTLYESTSASAEATASSASNDVAGGATGTQAATAPTASTTGSTDNNSSSTPTSVLVGSVVGGVAGLTVLFLIAMLLMKWKRQRSSVGHRLLDAGNDSLPTGGGNGGGGSGGGKNGPGGMSDLRTAFLLPFAAGPTRLAIRDGATVEAAAATAAGAGASREASTERGFYRVSGKKLPSVLSHGGDGYEDPRASLASESAVVHRDSQGFFGGAGGPSTTPMSRYAVGSPMRPESGVPVFHQTGPGRAVAPMRLPLARQGSYVHDGTNAVDEDEDDAPLSTWAPSTTSRRSVPMSPLSPPPPLGRNGLDPIGRSHASQDGSRVSRGSGSRFMEVIH